MLLFASKTAAIERALLAADPWLLPYAAQLRAELEAAAAHGARTNDDAVARWGADAMAARRAATLGRFRAGHPAWTEWAQALQRLHRDLAPQPSVKRAIASVCAADFRAVTFDTAFEAAGWEWPTLTCFADALFADAAWQAGCTFRDRVAFTGARFLRDAVFERSQFLAGADFSGAAFSGASEFRLCVFKGKARFGHARFAGDAWFRGSRFARSASFAESGFQGEAGLGDVAFEGDADFSRVSFGDNAGFEQSVFRRRAIFAGARFARNTWFVDNAFATPPDFDRAHFAGRVRVDEAIPMWAKSPVHRQIAQVEAALAGANKAADAVPE
jgi:uncharacterized protein YjbI with pentapeptide repeats